MLAGVLLAAVAHAPPSHAAGPSPAQVQAARELFQDAERDEDAKRWSDALDKLRRVAAVKLTPGVRYHIALCEENLGQLVAALADYTLAENQARAENAPDVLRLVGEKLKSLKTRVPRLTLAVADIPDIEVRLDGEPILKAMWGVQIPLDPGEHKIEAKAPGRVAMARTIKMDERDSTLIEVKLPEALKTPPPPSTPAPSGSAMTASSTDAAPAPAPPTAGHGGAIAATLGAAVLIGGGVIAFVYAGQTHDDNAVTCSTRHIPCDDLKQQVQLWDTVALSAWIGAAALTAVAVVLWASPAASAKTPTRGELYVGPGALGIKGSF
jgi:hypothetical protein